MANINDKRLNGYFDTPGQWYLACSLMALNQFWAKANDTNIIDSLTKGFTQPLDYINFIRVYPFNIMGDTYTEENVPVPIANKFIDVPNNRTDVLLKTSHIGNSLTKIHKSYTFTFDTITKFNQLEPYTTIECFLPYVGFISLSPSEIYGTITIDLIIDVISGNGTYMISRGDYVIYTAQANFSVDIALGGTNNIEQFKAQFNNGVSTLLGIGMSALGVYSNNPFLASSGVGQAISGITNIPNSNTSNVIKRGVLGNYSTNFFNPHSIYFIIKSKKVSDYDSFKSVYGKPLNQYVNLYSLKGMTYIPNPILEINRITSQEYDTLVNLMQNGIILDNSTNTLKVYNVKLRGSYNYPRIKLSNVRLYGDYRDKYKLTLANMRLDGTYKEKPIIQISNVNLSGSYIYKSQVSISNVGLSGSYRYKDTLNISNVTLSGSYDIASTLEVSNVTLSGSYDVASTLEVSNVTLSGSYRFKDTLNISNATLSGSYDVASTLEVSNVTLSGSYKEIASNKLNVSNVNLYGDYQMPTCTLTIELFKNYVYYDTKYRTYEIGDTVSPKGIAVAYKPDDYIISSYSPNSDFTITSDTKLKVYYEYVEPTPTYYDLTIQLYKDGTLYSTKHKSYEEGTLVNPSTLATSYQPTSYEIDSYNPSKSFYMFSDRTLSIYYVHETVYETLTINLYKDNVIYDTITKEYEYGDTIAPLGIATLYKPDNYIISSYSPSNNFEITSNTTLDVYYTYVEPTPTYYDVTIYLYKNGTLYSTKHESYKEGSTVMPDSIAESYRPTDYDIDSYTPTNDFQIYSDSVVNVYYTYEEPTPPTPTYYDVTIYLYKMGNLYATKHETYEDGSTVMPDSIAESYRPKDYYIESYTPSSDFVIHSDSTINVYYSQDLEVSVSASAQADSGGKVNYSVTIDSNKSGNFICYLYAQASHVDTSFSGSGSGSFSGIADATAVIGDQLDVKVVYTYGSESVTENTTTTIDER